MGLRTVIKNPQRGFTLLELLAALAIIGFLLAMIAPRLAGVRATAAEVTTKTTMTRLIAYLTNDLQRNGDYPQGMINIVSVDSAGRYHKPLVSDRDPQRPEVLSAQIDERHRLHIHYLNTAEAEELHRLGIRRLYSYNSPYDYNPEITTRAPYMQLVAAGVAVLMTGGGDENGDGKIDGSEVSTNEVNRAHPDQLFRIVFGLGPECSLVQNGTVFNAPLCPDTTVKPKNYGWHYYSVLLPRLTATATRLQQDMPLKVRELHAYGVKNAAATKQLSTARVRIVDIFARQHHSFFEVMDALGNTRPGPDMHGWGLDFNGDGAIGRQE